MLTVFYFFYKNASWATVIMSVGCSGIAASLMAIILYFFDLNNKKKQLKLYKKIYIIPIQEEILRLFQKILWLEDNIDNPEINWHLNLNEYLKLDFYMYTTKYESKKKYTIDETIKIMNDVSVKYELTHEKQYDEKTRKAFQIVYGHSKFLGAFLLNLDNNKPLLDWVGVISLEKVETLLRQYSYLDYVFNKSTGNIGSGIRLLINMFTIVRELCNFDKEVTPSFAGRY